MRFNRKKIKKEYYFISILLILFIILTIFVISGKTSYIDEMTFNSLISLKNKPLTNSLYVITSLGSTVGIIISLIVTLVIFLRYKALSDFKYVLGNVGFGVILMKVLKTIIRRVRPSWKWIVQGGFSYPSGHTISSLLFYGTLILLINKKVKGRYKKPLIYVFSLMILLIGISRIYFGVHYLTDVVASILLGSIILIISNIIMNREFNNDKNKIKK